MSAGKVSAGDAVPKFSRAPEFPFRVFLHFRHDSDTSSASSRVLIPMATPIIFGVGAIAAAMAGRSLLRRGILGGRGSALEWAKGGFKAKMDRKEALAILGLRCVPRSTF